MQKPQRVQSMGFSITSNIGSSAVHKNKSNINDFVLKARSVHGDRYCYSDSVYGGSRSKINIRCKKHGVFSQLVTNHLKGSGCQKCRSDKVSEKSSIGLKVIKDRISATHGNKYKYNFDGVSKVTDIITITCLEHGDFRQNVRLHISGCGCRSCGIAKAAISRSSNAIDFISRAKGVHGDLYDYSNVVYKTARIHVDIICKKHGVFRQIPYSHLTGCGCAKCDKENATVRSFGFNREAFIKTSKKNQGKAILYLVKLVGADEVFYKIGITSRCTEVRIAKIHNYKKQIIREVRGDAGFIFDLEGFLHEKYKNLRYEPLMRFDGYTECFKDLPKDLYNILDNHTMSDIN